MAAVSPFTGKSTAGWSKPEAPAIDLTAVAILDKFVTLTNQVKDVLRAESEAVRLRGQISSLEEQLSEAGAIAVQLAGAQQQLAQVTAQLAEARKAASVEPIDNTGEMITLQALLVEAKDRADRAENNATETVRRIREQYAVSLKSKGKPMLVVKPPATVTTEVRKDATGLLTGLVLKATGYKDITVRVSRGADNQVNNLNLT